jgi:hypothetical protein
MELTAFRKKNKIISRVLPTLPLGDFELDPKYLPVSAHLHRKFPKEKLPACFVTCMSICGRITSRQSPITQRVGIAVTLWSYSKGSFGLNLVQITVKPDWSYLWVPQPIQTSADRVSSLHHYWFLPDPFQFIIYLSPYYSTLLFKLPTELADAHKKM